MRYKTDAIEQIMSDHPTLGVYGYLDPRDPEYAARRADMLSERGMRMFRQSCMFLDIAGAAGHAMGTSPDKVSYHLKHVAERWVGDYIANGMLIAAAVRNSIPLRRCTNNSPNAYIFINLRGLERRLQHFPCSDPRQHGETP